MAQTRGDPKAGDETRQRILDAAFATLRDEGIAGTSARAIGRRGDLNPALIFYHFGSVEQALYLACSQVSEVRVARYRERLSGITSITELVAAARELHAEDVADGSVAVVTQMLAGAVGSPALADRMLASFQDWIDVVQEALVRVVGGTAFSDLVGTDELAFTIAAMFLGIELLTHLDPSRRRDEPLFETLGQVGRMVESLLNLGTVGSAAVRRRMRRS